MQSPDTEEFQTNRFSLFHCDRSDRLDMTIFVNYRSFSIKIQISIHDLDYIGRLKISQLKNT